MKSKRISAPGMLLLKWHIFVFVVFTISLWLSVLATFSYSGNAEVPFAVFKPFLIERMSLNVLWGLVLLIHFGAQQVRGLLLQRVYNAHLKALHLTDEISAEDLKIKRKRGDEDTPPLNEDAHLFKSER